MYISINQCQCIIYATHVYIYIYIYMVSDEAYQHAENVWNVLELENMGGYHVLYLIKSDVLLLADVFENFRRTCRQHYKLDPCHYFTSPGLACMGCNA